MDERLSFIERHRQGERVTDLCREFNISRKTGHRLLRRWNELGKDALVDQSRAPKRCAHRLSKEVIDCILGFEMIEPGNEFQQCGFAAPVAPDQPDVLAGGKGHVHLPQHDTIAESKIKIGHAEDGHGGSRLTTGRGCRANAARARRLHARRRQYLLRLVADVRTSVLLGNALHLL